MTRHVQYVKSRNEHDGLVDQVVLKMQDIPPNDVVGLYSSGLPPLVHRKIVVVVDCSVDRELEPGEVLL